MSLIFCACGCGQQREEFDSQGRRREYIRGHSRRDKHHSERTKKILSENHKDKYPSEKTKQKMSDSRMGDKNHMYGKHPSEETLKKMSDVMSGEKNPRFGKHGKDSPTWKGGEKLSKKKINSKRRKLGFNPINKPISDDMIAHHLTKEFVAYVPEFINKSVGHNIHTGKNMDEVNFYTLNYLFLIYNKEEQK